MPESKLSSLSYEPSSSLVQLGSNFGLLKRLAQPCLKLGFIKGDDLAVFITGIYLVHDLNFGEHNIIFQINSIGVSLFIIDGDINPR